MRRQFIRFVLVGIVNTGFSYALYAALLYAGLGYVVASLLSIILGIGVSFATQGTLVFGGASHDAFIRFVAVWVIIYLAYLMVVAIADYLGINNYFGGLIATPMVVCLSYILQRYFVFRITRDSRNPS